MAASKGIEGLIGLCFIDELEEEPPQVYRDLKLFLGATGCVAELRRFVVLKS
jgi:hypothetical protein